MNAALWFSAGAFVGALLGVFVMSMAFIAREGDVEEGAK